MRQSEEAAEQARQLLEAHSWAEAGGTNEPNGSECGRYVSSWQGTGAGGTSADMDNADLERLRRENNQKASVARTQECVTGRGCFVPGQDGFNGDEYKKSSEQWKPDLETKPL